jgi:hypothetical protein
MLCGHDFLFHNLIGSMRHLPELEMRVAVIHDLDDCVSAKFAASWLWHNISSIEISMKRLLLSRCVHLNF